MGSTTFPAVWPSGRSRFLQKWLFTGIALGMVLTAALSFVPSVASPATRRAPLSVLAAVHGLVFFAWLLLFLAQTALIATSRRSLHRRLGYASIALLALMIPSAYATTIDMVRHGFDLSGDLHIDHDAAYQAVFPLCNLLVFSVLAIAALAYRGRPQLHKRLMLFANIELMPAPLAHFIGHNRALAALPGAIITVPIALFVLAAVARDLLESRRVHPLTWALASLRMLSGPLEAGPIGNSAAWHHLISWLAG